MEPLLYRIYGKSHLSLQCKQRPSQEIKSEPSYDLYPLSYLVPTQSYSLGTYSITVLLKCGFIDFCPWTLRDIQNHTWELILQADHRSCLSWSYFDRTQHEHGHINLHTFWEWCKLLVLDVQADVLGFFFRERTFLK